MNEIVCPSCKYGKIERKNPLMYFLGLINCPYCKGEVAPNLMHEVLLTIVAPIIACAGLIVLLEGYHISIYISVSALLTAFFLYFLYKSPIRIVAHKKILGQKILFGPTRPAVIGPLVIFGFGAMLWAA
ncbi:hypothetical protein MIB92_19335 [Aestuariirhabdus sp. Z084]|uniref:hypothetical protein n=1 Tax=Aestuariirhabdus haliotis TaxID=2918751 RepID=UPI00201B38C9|nr:hypothetical protein [Aestuariirhabdus haliotis]MCL6417811.1 hypothetical protein [Aestuariirhabdus haliotis]MCL6421732.1 hypothetical protein [Aestuariirhabdus haliotis]